MLAIRTINYAAPPAGSYWNWSADYDAVEWHDGSTLALWQELQTVINYLGEAGCLPPLGAMLLLLGACRDEWLRTINFHPKVMEILGVTTSDDIPLEIKTTLVTGLKTVHDLPKELRSSLAAKCHLVAALFEGGPHSLTREDSNLVMRQLAVPGPRALAGCVPVMDAKARFIRDLRALRIGLARHDAASLENFLRTGLDEATLRPVVLAEKAVEAGEPGELLDRLLAAGGETGAAAAVAKRAIAMMNFPGQFGTPRDLPVGGIADITNRGTVDRLLPGELAWDDLVLAARLVHNEALYFRREMPPMNVALRHTVLLDRGLRLWGTGRVFALGVALGLRQHPSWQGRGETFQCVAATGVGCEPLDLGSPQGIRSALGTLVPAPSPVVFLRAWWETASQEDDRAIPDVSFVTAREHLDHAETRGLLGEIAAWIHTRNGHFRVLALTRAGQLEAQAWLPGGIRSLFRGELDLAAIVAGSRLAAPPPLRKPTHPLRGWLPIYALERLPFLFPLAPQLTAFLPDQAVAGSNHGGLGVTVNRRLLYWPQPGWGGRELLPAVPGRQHWLGRDDHGTPILIASGEQAGDAVRVFAWRDGNLAEIEIERTKHPFPRHASVSGGAAIVAYSDSVEAFSLATGRRVAQQSIKWPITAPVFLFDDDSIMVFEPEEQAPSAAAQWSVVDATWPRLIVPDGISWSYRGLAVRCGETAYGFNPVEIWWHVLDTADVDFATFERSHTGPAGEENPERAALGGGAEAWLDSRGFLTLSLAEWGRQRYLSILLTSGAANAWHQTWGVLTHEPRLRPPGNRGPDVAAIRFLTNFLAHAYQHPPA
jgi:hypothetical protein